MALPEQKLTCTVEEYLELERKSDERHQFVDGEIYEMAGETLAHSQITANWGIAIGFRLRGKRCQVLSPNMKIRSGPYVDGKRNTKGLFSYADVMVVCGEPRFHDKEKDVLLNPTVLIEVLSPSTADFDRGGKFFRYRQWIDTLVDYIVASQTAPLIEHYQRQPNGTWLLTQIEGLDATLQLASIDCHLKLSEIYDRVEFPPPELLAEAEETGAIS